MKPLKLFVITDTHYYAKSLDAFGEEYERFMDFEQKCYAETPYINDAVFHYLKNAKDADIVLIAGDLSFNGEKASHEEFSRVLRDLQDSGKDVYVVTAGHDIEQNPFAYDDVNGRKPAEGVKFSDLYGYYRDFGYDKAISFYKENLSYVAQLSEDVRLLVLCNDSAENKNIAYTDELLDWAKEQMDKAKADGQMMIAMEHYPVLPGQPILTLIPDARQKESKKLYTLLADNGVHLIFTGHMHNQSINVVETEKGNKFYDVCTGSVIGCPAFMRLVTIENEETVHIKSIPVPEFEWDKKGKTGDVYLKEQFERMIRTIINGMKDDPARILHKFGAGDKTNLYGIVSKVGGFLSTCTVGKMAKLFCVKCDKKIKDMPFVELAVDIVRYAFEGDQPFVEGTPEGDTILRVFKRLKPVFKILNKKLHGSQGEEIDMYELLKHSIGNYGISDYDAMLILD
ncbi:MAG: metallophosphoesterase [Clostridia bacterium]|nr:metallophosphoesterase [Clostridia bacterium]